MALPEEAGAGVSDHAKIEVVDGCFVVMPHCFKSVAFHVKNTLGATQPPVARGVDNLGEAIQGVHAI